MLADFPLASIVVSGIVTTILIAGVYWIDRRHLRAHATSRNAAWDVLETVDRDHRPGKFLEPTPRVRCWREGDHPR